MASPAPAEAFTIESVRIPAGDHDLVGELAYPDSIPTGGVIIAGPHPLLGGTMHNNVVRALGDGLAARGCVTLRFGYRDGGLDPQRLAQFWRTSRAPDEPEWGDDLCSAVEFLRGIVPPQLPLALVGYSFGCTLLPAALRGDAALVLIAPTVGHHDFSAFESLGNPKLVIAPLDDFAADASKTERWLDRLPDPKQIERPQRDGHFFRGHEDWLAETVGDFLDATWGGKA
jgi:alpha/beta superfamily hydrolase